MILKVVWMTTTTTQDVLNKKNECVEEAEVQNTKTILSFR